MSNKGGSRTELASLWGACVQAESLLMMYPGNLWVENYTIGSVGQSQPN